MLAPSSVSVSPTPPISLPASMGVSDFNIGSAVFSPLALHPDMGTIMEQLREDVLVRESDTSHLPNIDAIPEVSLGSPVLRPKAVVPRHTDVALEELVGVDSPAPELALVLPSPPPSFSALFPARAGSLSSPQYVILRPSSERTSQLTQDRLDGLSSSPRDSVPIHSNSPLSGPVRRTKPGPL